MQLILKNYFALLAEDPLASTLLLRKAANCFSSL
jgi:hypothetical protein